MVKKQYDWENGAILDDHTRIKHKVLSEYFRQYLITRCQLPIMERFRVVIVDGFSGAGLYRCGSFGSPLIFIDILTHVTNEINLDRINRGLRTIQVECLLIVNDSDTLAIDQLKKNIAPLAVKAKEVTKNLTIDYEYSTGPFESVYQSSIKRRLQLAKCSNVFFNLDQSGYSHVTTSVIQDIMKSWNKAEVLLTFMIKSMLAYMSPEKHSDNTSFEPAIREEIDLLRENNNLINKKEWLASAEKVVFGFLKGCAPYVSPFSINNPNGWRYWLIHFSNVYRARQVYNNILHEQPASQAHCGRSGLRMLSYDPHDEMQLYLFDTNSRKLAKESLFDDIPRLVAESGDTLTVEDFYATAYNETPAHSNDMHEMIIENPDLEVITKSGGKRRKANTIKAGDTLKLTSQKSLFSMFPRMNDN